MTIRDSRLFQELASDRHHSDLIEAMPSGYRRVPYIEVEAKHKELAIEKLRAGWLGGKTSEAAA